MPSQEDYLKELMEEDGDPSRIPDLDALAEMSEEEIAARLLAGNAEGQSGQGDMQGDVLDLAGEGSDLQEIQELLRKSDRNEAVDGREDFPGERDQAERLRAEIEGAGETEAVESTVDSRKEKALEKKRLKAEKKAARAAAKAEKGRRRKAKKGGIPEQARQETERPEALTDRVEEYDVVKDRDILDSIVSEAAKVEDREEPQVDLMEVAAALDAERHIDPSEEIPYDNIGDTMLDGDSGVMALDLDEVDDYIPDISAQAQDEGGPKKKGVISRFMDFLMEEEPENEDVPISEENQEIIREMDKAQAQKAKKKVQKKTDKKKKEKQKKEKKPKKVKEPKPRKEKKAENEDSYPVRKLSFKKVFPILVLGASVGAAIFIFAILSIDFTTKQTARTAFDNGDYQTCYASLHGRKLSGEEEIMYGKSECILHIRMWYQEYMYLASQGGGSRALDSLIQDVHEYPDLYEYASRWGAAEEVGQVYASLLDILYEQFRVTEEQAREIAALKSDIAYTRAVLAIAGEDGSAAGGSGAGTLDGDGSGDGYTSGEAESSGDGNVSGEAESSGDGNVSGEAGASEDGEEPGMQQEPADVLPEEAELETGDFVDNQ